jgi:proline iminopeptidase
VAKESGRMFRGASATLYYEILGEHPSPGSATPLVVVNGGPGVAHDYMHCSDVWDAVARERPVVFYDQRGTGRSPALRKGQSCTVADQIADLDALLRALHFERVDLLGHSWGGYVAMAYGALHPQRIEHMVICDSAAPKLGDTIFMFENIYPEVVVRQKAVAFAEALGDSAAARTSFEEYLSMLFYSPRNRERYRALHLPYRMSQGVNEILWADAGRFDLNPELPKFRFPVLVITGRHDFNVAPSVAFKIHDAIPNSRILVFEESGHLPFFEEPATFQARLEEFLATPASTATEARSGETTKQGRP